MRQTWHCYEFHDPVNFLYLGFSLCYLFPLFSFLAVLLLNCLRLKSCVFMVYFLNDDAPESNISLHIGSMTPYRSDFPVFSNPLEVENSLLFSSGDKNSSGQNSSRGNDQSRSPSIPPPATITTPRDVIRSTPRLGHQCENFTLPPPPPPGSKKIGPRRKFEGFF